MEISRLKIPVKFELEGMENDTRFQPVKIWICYTGENLNYTYFPKDTLVKMAETLPYIPIVGFIKSDGDDFKGHEMAIEVKDNKADLVYKGQAYGFIPKDPEATFEERDGKEWLTCKGFLWNKFTKAIGLFSGSDGVKNQSMEIQDVEGFTDDFGRQVYTEARFNSLCILGDDVEPAMLGSTVEFYSEIKSDIQKMIQEFSLQKGEEKVADKKEVKDEKEVEDKKSAKVSEDKKEKAPEDKEEKKVEDTKEEATPEDKTEKEESKEDKKEYAKKESEPSDKKDEEDKKKEAKFELSVANIGQQLSKAIRNKFGKDDNWCGVVDIYDTHAVFFVEDFDDDYYGDNRKFFDIEFEKNENEITISENVKEVFPTFVTKEQQAKLDADKQEVESLKTRLSELEEFKACSDKKEKEEVLKKFSKELDLEDINELTENIDNFTKEELDKEASYRCFKKIKNFAKKDEFKVIPNTNTESKYGDLDRYFKQ